MIQLQDFLHPGERKLLQRIMQIARDYHHFQEFIRSVLELNTHKINAQSAQEGTIYSKKKIKFHLLMQNSVFQGNNFNEACTSKSISKVETNGINFKKKIKILLMNYLSRHPGC